MPETLTCPICFKAVNSTKTVDLRDDKVVTCNACKLKSTLGQWRDATPSPNIDHPAVPCPPTVSPKGTAKAPENAIVGNILESRYKKAGPIAKGLSGLSFLFLFVYYLVALLLCFTCIGIIVAVFMVTGAMAFQAALLYVMTDGWVYVAECPLCNRRIERLFLPDGQSELSQPCPSCKKQLIVRKGLVFHIP